MLPKKQPPPRPPPNLCCLLLGSDEGWEKGSDGNIRPVKHLELGLQDHRCCSEGVPAERKGAAGSIPLFISPTSSPPTLHVSIPYSQAGAEDDPGAAVALDVPVVVAVVLERGNRNLH